MIVHIIDAAVHLSRLIPHSYLLAPATTLPSPQTSESWRRICTPQKHHNNIVQMCLRCVAVAPPTCNHTLHHIRRTAPFSTLSLIKFIFGALHLASARSYPHPPARFGSTTPWRASCRPLRARCTRRVRRTGVTRGDRRRYPDPRDIPRIARRRVGARRHLHLRRHQTAHPRRRRTPRRFSSRASSPSPRPAARPRHPRTSAPSPTR